MERRDFLASTLGTAIVAAAGTGTEAQTPAAQTAPEFYVWRQYILKQGTQARRLAEFLQAAIPALNRLGHSPIGVFEVLFGLPTPGVFVLMALSSLDAMQAVEAELAKDAEFMKAADPYFTAPATDPVYVRQELSLLRAFPSMPRLQVPAQTAAKAPRLFELRIYESHNERAHLAKMRMFDELGEIEIFRKVGLTPVFFARTIFGTRMPNLTYLLVHDNMAAREKSWDGFRTSPDWKKLAATPGYADPEIVSNITTIFLRPAGYSQI